MTYKKDELLYYDYCTIPISSQTAAVLSKEQVAKTWPNCGCAHATFHTEPE